VRAGPLPPLEWTSFPPLMTAVFITPTDDAVLITPTDDASPGSRRIGVIGALIYFLPSQTVGARGGGGL